MPRVPSTSPATGLPTHSSFIHTIDSQFVDNAGRTLLMRGVNLSGSSKAPVGRPSYMLDGFWENAQAGGESFVGRPLNLDDGSADVHLARLSGWGFNLLRFPITWEALEHKGPGKYDQEFMAYTVRVLQKCREYGFRVYMDPHQDTVRHLTWSRFSGGSGAPYWTLAACGVDPRNITATQAAILHSEYPHPQETDPAKLPAMLWSTNYGRLISQTVFTLFYAGRDFAPHCIIDGQNIQDYLQSHYIEAVGQLADCIHETDPTLFDDCVIGWDSMNEPFEGLVGWDDLNQNPQKQGTTLKKGTHPTPAQNFRLGMGKAQTVENWSFGSLGPSRDGTITIDPKGCKVWGVADGESPDGVNDHWGWRRDTTRWLLGSCIWALHGVWDIETGFVNRPEYFRYHPTTGVEVEFISDYWRPHFVAYARRIRKAHPEAIMFVQPPVFAQPPSIEEETLKGRCAYTGHYYDGLTLITRHWNWFNADALGLLRGKYSSTLQAVKIGESAIRRSLQQQMEMLKDDAKILGSYPAVIGEIGIPYDMDGKRSYGWTDGGKYKGNYSRQEKALDASLNGCDGDNALNWTMWTYCPDHSHDWGDGWNMEDLSIWSPDDLQDSQDQAIDLDSEARLDNIPNGGSQIHLLGDVSRVTTAPGDHNPRKNQTHVYPTSDAMSIKKGNGILAGWDPNPYHFLTNGARAPRAFCRPWPRKIIGTPKNIFFDLKKAHFRLVVTVSAEDKPNLCALEEADPATEIYVPLVHYAVDQWLPEDQRKSGRNCMNMSSSATQSDRKVSKACKAAETSSIASDSESAITISTVHPACRAILEKNMVDVDISASSGRWSIEGQVLKWWYDVPSPGEPDREYVIEVRRRGGVIKAKENRREWIKQFCSDFCSIM
ncbi:glycoside hydrolase family 5 protein [Amanita thiersii Skay4041]|uniref:Glycoside hydrolase family 5 protein n=1 Tax=Amanita thiersii Skay4041 TaxID=703135 RepID=A0A2A9NZW1_9AGAR|nr:glycoside hydrolase family 5 protein [Amanita thiersii Skay4041]